MIVRIRLEGITPMLQNRAGDEVLDSLWVAQGGILDEGELCPKSNKGKGYRQYCEEYCMYRGPNNEFGIPAQNLFASLRGGGRRVKLEGMTRVSSKDSTLLTGALTILEDFLMFENQEKISWVPDRRRGQASNSAKKAMVPVIRPRFDKWSLWVTVDIDKAEIPEDKIKRVFEKAGRTSGIGDFRPSTNGPFGQFKVTEWQVVEATEDDEIDTIQVPAPSATI
ncbi:MAG: hypothetical protein ABIF06_02180 [bacterium]